MKALISQRMTLVVLSLLVLGVLLVSCVPNANEPILSPQLGPILVAREAGQVVVALPTPTPVLITTLSQGEILAGLPADVEAALASADTARAEQVALAYGCVGCHSLDPNQPMSGPTWYHMGDTAVSRVPGESPALYLYESIVAPNAYIVPGYQAGIMPQDFGDRLSTQELADLVAYLLEQHE
jgi:mono/diheme cytochrome c family protein